MCAREATPLTLATAGWHAPTSSLQNPGLPAGTFVPSTPAITPATKVPWKDCSRLIDPPLTPGPAKPFATITFGVVPPLPLGKPGGYERPVGARNACSVSTP